MEEKRKYKLRRFLDAYEDGRKEGTKQKLPIMVLIVPHVTNS